jgi:hypothetical protein
MTQMYNILHPTLHFLEFYDEYGRLIPKQSPLKKITQNVQRLKRSTEGAL